MAVTTPPGIRNIVGQLAEILTVTIISRICIDIRKAGLPRKFVGCGSDTFLRTASPVQFADLEDIQVVEFTGALTVDAGGG